MGSDMPESDSSSASTAQFEPARDTATTVTTLPRPQALPVTARPSWQHIAMPNFNIDDKLGRILLSIVLSVLLWFYVVNLENPEQTTQFPGLNVEVRGTGSNLKVVSTIPTVDASVQAPQNVMNTLQKSDIRPYIDLTGLEGGVYKEVPVRAQITGNQTANVQVSFAPSRLEVQLEVQATRTFSVSVQTNGTPPVGYGLEPTADQVQPSQVRVSGNQEAISRISQVVVPVDVEGKAVTQTQSEKPRAYDSDKKEITGLTFDPPTVQVVVPVKLLFNYKVVPVRVPLQGQPAPGYRVSAIVMNPNNATICCSPGVLDPVQFLETNPVSITGTTSTVETTTQLILPTGVDLYPGQTKDVSVTISVEVLETTLQLSVAPSVDGLPNGYAGVISPGKMDLTLAGTFSQLQSLRPTDVRAVVNMQGRGAGTYDVQPQIVVPQGVKVVASSPISVSVTLVAPTPLPPTPTLTEQPTTTPAFTRTPEATNPASTVAPTKALATSTLTPVVPTATSTALPSVTPTPTHTSSPTATAPATPTVTPQTSQRTPEPTLSAAATAAP